MNITRIAGLILSLVLSAVLMAQEKFTVSGHVTDETNGEDLIALTVVEPGTTNGAVTNSYGFYSLTLEQGKHQLKFSYIGFQEQIIEVDLQEDDMTLNVKMKTGNLQLNEVTVTGKRKDENLSNVQMGMETLDMKQVEKMPVLLGEKDILKTIQLMPGISSTSEGSSGFSVRGGSTDQNLILLDEAPVYGASHLMGFFSVFNSDAIKGMTVYKGGIPANYGGRGSSVLDITMKDGNNQNFSASGGVGLISSRLTLEGPIVKDKMSFIVSGRRSYADLIGKAAGYFDDDMNLYFYDLNAKVNYKINDNNRLYLSGYFGQDDFGFEEMGMGWGNATGTLRWNHLYSNKLFSNTSLIYSKYDYDFNMGDAASMSSGIEDYGFKQDFTFYLNPDNTMKYGLQATYHTFNPGELLFDDSDDSEIILDKTKGLESAMYWSNNQKLGDKLSAEYGLRLSMFNQFGEGYSNTYDDNNNKVDSVYYERGELMQTYWNVEPRLSLNYRLSDNSSVKASYNRMAQYLHLLSNSTSSQPTDTWVSSSTNIEPQIVSQYALGYFRNFFNNDYEFSVEGYYKTMDNVFDYEDGTDVLLNENIEAFILGGEGRSYGLEFYLKKKYGRFTGWASYTLSRTENKIDGINNGDWYNTKYDKTHDISLVGNFEINNKLSLSAAWVYYTGNAVTFPSGQYEYDGQIWPYYTERNGYRMPDYHRLDLNLHVNGKKRERFHSSWDFSVYNAYNRYNAYTISFQESESNPGATEAVQLSLFGIVPSVTWNFKF